MRPLTAFALLALVTASACSDDGPSSSATPTAPDAAGTTAGAAARPATASRGSVALAEANAAGHPVSIEVFAPENGDKVGVDGVGWFVDIAVDFPRVGDPTQSIAATGFTGNQLTGPGGHANIPPFPGAAAPGKDDRFQGLVVLISTSTVGAGSCQNLAGLFNLTGVTNLNGEETEIWDTWIIAAAAFGQHTQSTLLIAEVADLNHDGIHNDAPDVVPSVNGQGTCHREALEHLALDSEIQERHFFIR